MAHAKARIARTAAALGLFSLTALSAGVVQAESYVEKAGMYEISVGLAGAIPTLTVENTSNSNQISDLSLAVKESSVAIPITGQATCSGVQFENFAQRFGHYLSHGAFGVGDATFVVKEDLPDSTDINRSAAVGDGVFNLSINQLKGGQIGIDPVALVMQAANQAPNKAQFLRKDQLLVAKIPVRFEGACAYYERNKITKKTIREAGELSHRVVDVDLRIVYKGDPDLQQISLQLGQSGIGGQGGVQSIPQNFIEVTDGTFLQGEVHKSGRCPMTANFKLELTGAGDGQVKVRVRDDGDSYFQLTSQPIDFVKGKAIFEFSHELKRLAPFDKLNHAYQHDYKVYVSSKATGEQFFPAKYQGLPVSLQWSHECTKEAVVNPSLSLGGVGGVGGKLDQPADGGAATPSIPTLGAVNIAPADGGSRIAPTLQLKPASPTPTGTQDVQAKPVEPSPTPALKLQAQPVEESDRNR